MEVIINNLKSVSEKIFDIYMKAAYEKKQSLSLELVVYLAIEKALYKELLDKYGIDSFDLVIEQLDEEYDESEIITYAFECHNKKKLIKKRICDKLNNMVLIDSMNKGSKYIPEICGSDFDIDSEESFDSEIYFDGYLYGLAMGLCQIDLAYYLNEKKFCKAAYKLVFLNDFVETAFVSNKCTFEPYNPNDITLLDELNMISDDAKNKSLIDIQDIAMWYIDQYVGSNNKKYYQYASALLLSLSFEDSFDIINEYYNLFDEGLITKEHFLSSEKLVVNANDQRLELKY